MLKVDSKTAVSEYRKIVMICMSGYVIRAVKRKINCVDCQLVSTAETATVSENVGSQFMSMKNCGGLVKASEGVIFVCETIHRKVLSANALCYE